MFMEIDPYALAILLFLFFVLGALVGIVLSAWGLKQSKKREEKLKKKFEEEHKSSPPPP